MECTNNICSNGELLLLISSLPKGAQYSGINKHVYPKTLNFFKNYIKVKKIPKFVKFDI